MRKLAKSVTEWPQLLGCVCLRGALKLRYIASSNVTRQLICRFARIFVSGTFPYTSSPPLLSMNKFLLSAALVLSAATASLAGQLQGFAISGAPLITVRGGYSQTSDMEAAVVITNNTGRALSLRVQRQVRSAVTGSENYFCTPITCYTPTVTLAPASFALANGASNSDCHFYYTPNNQAGITTIRYAFFELGSQDSAYVTVRFDASQRVLATTASKAPESVLSQPWPNPAAAGTTSELTYALPANSR